MGPTGPVCPLVQLRRSAGRGDSEGNTQILPNVVQPAHVTVTSPVLTSVATCHTQATLPGSFTRFPPHPCVPGGGKVPPYLPGKVFGPARGRGIPPDRRQPRNCMRTNRSAGPTRPGSATCSVGRGELCSG
uniref:Uncharacterized protein n=1 Tax=Branchiostoma floridae TaxID=7739 RepID=C3ZD10_BRAFL|eukprot:XP_002593510.1 hypothetical protein BRAFLDRAFT_101841 [Branchiostoma floridae]